MTRFKISAGERFGRLTVVGRTDGGWLFQCDCGGQKIAAPNHVKKGLIKSCGCIRRGPARHDLSGKTFGRWYVVGPAEDAASGHPMWHCVCSCGTKRVVEGSTLTGSRCISCGCYQSEQMTLRATKHGMSATSEYRIWMRINQRCEREALPEYKNYGGRGIKVCDRWRNSFEAFYADMGPRPSKKHSVDRIDNDGDYEPGNCRWATAKEQCNNTRKNRTVVIRGEAMTLTQASERFGVNLTTLRGRIDKRGMSAEEAVDAPKFRRFLQTKGYFRQ